MANFKKVIRKLLGENFFYNNIDEIRKSTIDCKTFLDLGCGSNSPYLRYLHTKTHNATGVDYFESVVVDAKQSLKYLEVIADDALYFCKKQGSKSYDAVLAFDLVEHYPKEVSEMLILEMIRLAKKTVVIVTPNGYWPGMIDGPGMQHLCGWDVEELAKYDLEIFGGGASFMRSKSTSFLKFFPFKSTLAFQLFIFNATQPFVKMRPQKAYGLCAIKKL
jgi:2-polyprenyl-3-methyl-5-hydroxy-6-metoxy-1,4-benzoquinol methylase